MAKSKDKKADTQNLGLFKETLSVMFGLNTKTIDRIMAIVSNSEDKLNVKTYITRDKAGPRAVLWLRKAIAYARHEGSAKHEDGSDDFEFTKYQDLESTTGSDNPLDDEINPFDEPAQDEEADMEKPIKECTFRDYLMELQVSDDAVQAIQDVKQAAKNPDRYQKQNAAEIVNKEREVQKAKDDPNQAEKLQLIQAEKQAAVRRKRLADKEKRTEQQMGIKGALGERPGTGMM